MGVEGGIEYRGFCLPQPAMPRLQSERWEKYYPCQPHQNETQGKHQALAL